MLVDRKLPEWRKGGIPLLLVNGWCVLRTGLGMSINAGRLALAGKFKSLKWWRVGILSLWFGQCLVVNPDTLDWTDEGGQVW